MTQKPKERILRKLNAHREALLALEARDDAFVVALSRREQTASLLSVSGSSQEDTDILFNNTLRIMEARNDLLNAVKDHTDAMRETMREIDRLENPGYRWVLELRYTGLKTWREIGELMEISEAAARKKHERAINKLMQLS